MSCFRGREGSRPLSAGGGHNSISRQREQRLANYRATGIVPLRDAKLRKLPSFVEELAERVKTLDVTNNALAALPSSIASNFNLVKLIVAKNALLSLPREIGTLSNLKLVNLDGNLLTALPPELCSLERLETLSAADNEIASLPPDLARLRNLRILDVSGNRLHDLPGELGQCEALEELSAARNRIEAIPPGLGALQALRKLDLDGNRVAGVPTEVLRGCGNLQTLSLHDNPITPATLEATEGFEEFEKRRRTKFDKQIAAGVLMGKAGLDEGVDRNTTRE